MPMFYTPSPRKFHYQPRFYDPEKEKLEQMKAKYAAIREEKEQNGEPSDIDQELAYYKSRISEMEKRDKKESSQFSMKDLVRRREMPKFNYTPRFSGGTLDQDGQSVHNQEISDEDRSILERMKNNKFKRRYDISDMQYMQPVSAGKIMFFALIAGLLIIWLIF